MRVANFVKPIRNTPFTSRAQKCDGLYLQSSGSRVAKCVRLNKSVLLEPAIGREGFGFIAQRQVTKGSNAARRRVSCRAHAVL